jgi:phosphatidylglycerophosphate synthase
MLSYVPNVLSFLRIISSPILLLLASLKQQDMFAWLLAGALISDILDGAIARAFGFASELGAHLDSVADLLVFMAAAYGIWCFYPELIADHSAVFLVIISLWFGSSLAGIWRYGRMASFHTYLTRITACAMGFFLVILFLWGFRSWLFWVVTALVVISHLEEFIMMALLPTWTPNARGLYWVLEKRAKRG